MWNCRAEFSDILRQNLVDLGQQWPLRPPKQKAGLVWRIWACFGWFISNHNLRLGVYFWILGPKICLPLCKANVVPFIIHSTIAWKIVLSIQNSFRIGIKRIHGTVHSLVLAEGGTDVHLWGMAPSWKLCQWAEVAPARMLFLGEKCCRSLHHMTGGCHLLSG